MIEASLDISPSDILEIREAAVQTVFREAWHASRDETLTPDQIQETRAAMTAYANFVGHAGYHAVHQDLATEPFASMHSRWAIQTALGETANVVRNFTRERWEDYEQLWQPRPVLFLARIGLRDPDLALKSFSQDGVLGHWQEAFQEMEFPVDTRTEIAEVSYHAARRTTLDTMRTEITQWTDQFRSRPRRAEKALGTLLLAA